jgi:hypothetical protein
VNLATCASLNLVPETKVWYRATELRFFSDLIKTAHTKAVISRFSAGLKGYPETQDFPKL